MIGASDSVAAGRRAATMPGAVGFSPALFGPGDISRRMGEHQLLHEEAAEDVLSATRLPSAEFEEERQRLVLREDQSRVLARYAELLHLLQQSAGACALLNQFVLFEGEPGTGKSMSARAMAQTMAQRHRETFCNDTAFAHLRVSRLFCEHLGKTGRTIASAFEQVRGLVRRHQTILMIDELDSLGLSRARLSAGDPSDVARAVNELLTQLDGMRGWPTFLAIGTTNLLSVLDQALLDRADIVVHFDAPDAEAGARILLQAARDVESLGIRIGEDELRAAAAELCGDGNGHRASGRLLAKLPLLAYLDGRSSQVTAQSMIEVARRRAGEQEAGR
ncbi:MAG: AAA family ATPase [Planctomycetes bacterium]|nr:AAA family ATPase [Planctomycetota bacterium]